MTTIRQALRTMLAGVVLASGAVMADGLPGEYLLTQRWRDQLAEHSPLTNPAFLTEEDYLSARIAFSPVMQGAFKLLEAGVSMPLGWYQTVGLTVLAEFDPQLESSVFDGSGQMVPDTSAGAEDLKNSNGFVMLSYAANVWRGLSLGANLNLAVQSNFNREATYGLGLDLGLSYRLLRHPVAGEHLVGAYLLNLIPPSMTAGSPKLDFGSAGQYATDLKLTWIGKYLERRLESQIDLHLKDIFAQADEFQAAGSAGDAAKSIEWSLDMRASAWVLRIFKLGLQLGFDDTGVGYWGLAGGVNVPMLNGGRDFELLYQFNLKTESDISSSHTIYLRADIGKHREEMYARRVAGRMSLAPSELYSRAMTLYSQQKYWDAFFVFSQIVSQYPDFFKNDRVSYYRGRCLQQMDMRQQAQGIYEQTLRDYTKSDIVPHALLGLMEIFYRQNQPTELFDRYLSLNRADTPDSLRYHGNYLMGEMLMRNERYRDALAVFNKIPPTHPEYAFAQHSAAVCNVLQDDMVEAQRCMENALSIKPHTPAQAEIVNRTCVLMGYVFYERNSLAEAITALRMVPATSVYAEEALLGQAWTALRARQWADCRLAAEQLVRTSKDPIVQEEGNLLAAYSLVLQKSFPPALDLLRKAAARLDTVKLPTEEDLQIRRGMYNNDRFAYDSLGREVVQLSLRQAAGAKGSDSMHVSQEKMRVPLERFYRYEDGYHRALFFGRSLDRVKADVNYALAVVQNIVERRDQGKAQLKADEKQKQLDQQIEKLKKEMEGLEKK